MGCRGGASTWWAMAATRAGFAEIFSHILGGHRVAALSYLTWILGSITWEAMTQFLSYYLNSRLMFWNKCRDYTILELENLWLQGLDWWVASLAFLPKVQMVCAHRKWINLFFHSTPTQRPWSTSLALICRALNFLILTFKICFKIFWPMLDHMVRKLCFVCVRVCVSFEFVSLRIWLFLIIYEECVVKLRFSTKVYFYWDFQQKLTI